MGLCEGPSYPSMGTLLGKMDPAPERSKAVLHLRYWIFARFDAHLRGSTSISNFVRLAHDDAPLGLRLLIEHGRVVRLCHETARECIRISVRELEYLRQHGIGKAPHHDKKGRHAPFPYALFKFSQAGRSFLRMRLLTSGGISCTTPAAVLVEELGQVAVAAGQHILVGQIFDCIGKFGFAPFADRAIRNNPSSRTKVRKVISGTAFVAFAASMAGLAVSYSVAAATCWLIVAKIASSAHVCGFKSNYLDLTQTHNGVLTAWAT